MEEYSEKNLQRRMTYEEIYGETFYVGKLHETLWRLFAD